MKQLIFAIIIALAITSYSYSQATNNLVSRSKNLKEHKSGIYSLQKNFPEKIQKSGQAGLQRQNTTDNPSSVVLELWAARYSSADSSSDFENYMTVDVAGNVYVTGVDFSYGFAKIVTIKYNSNGDSVWVARYYDGDSEPFSLAVDGSGNIYVTGLGSDTVNGSDFLTIKYNSSGVEQWVKRYNGPVNGEDYSLAMALDASGNIYVTGVSTDVGLDFVTIKYNSSGTELWVNRYSAPTNSFLINLSSIAVDVSGNAYVANTLITNDTNSDYITIKINSSGVQQWAKTFDGTGNIYDSPNSVAFDNSGNVFVTGVTTNSDYSSSYATVKYNSSGAEQWVRKHDYSLFGGKSIKTDNAGNIYVTGGANEFTAGFYEDYVTIKYNTNGDSLWVAKYSGIINSGDAGYALALDGGGNVYVTGITSSLNDLYWEYGTVKYNSSGVQKWAIRYAGDPVGDNYPNSIEVWGPGYVYVSGTSDGNGTHQDFATIKYFQDDPQPVELSSFNSTINKRDVTLNWSTSSETNNSGFDIERSIVNGQWSIAGSVQGSGTTTTPMSYLFIDRGLNKGKYNYRLKQIDFNGNFKYFNLSNEVSIGIPDKYNLSQNYPNPFNPSTKINYDLAFDGRVSLKLFDISGREVATIVNEVQTAGYYTATFNASNLSSGVYFYKLQSGDFIQTKKMTLIK